VVVDSAIIEESLERDSCCKPVTILPTQVLSFKAHHHFISSWKVAKMNAEKNK